ncbi:hypothetical protein ACFYP4_22295 [Streptomyces sp. NPDC005551]|uniref:hypothetical protein n=1 Tax=unclassified Streptomyces TaxID=2593676 RepID=UPI003407E399
MFVLLVLVIAVLFGLGFLNPVWWVAAALLALAARRHRRDHGPGWGRPHGADAGEYREYAARRDRRHRWERRYNRQHQARWIREERQDRQHDIRPTRHR